MLNKFAFTENRSFLQQPYANGALFAIDLFHAGFLLGLFFGPEEGDERFFQNVGSLSTEIMTLRLRR